MSGFGAAPETSPWVVHSSKHVTAPTHDETRSPPVNADAVDVKIVSYGAQYANDVYAMICSPVDHSMPPLQRKLVIANHGGAAGTSKWDAYACLEWAREDWVYAASAYRGEPLYVPNETVMFPNGVVWTNWGMTTLNGASVLPPRLLSGGQIEISLGEVNDVMRLLDLMRAQPNVDPNRVLMLGYSHGGAITLRAVQNRAPVRAAAVFAPATDWAQLVRECQAREPLVLSDSCRPVLYGANLSLSGLAQSFRVPAVYETVGDSPGPRQRVASIRFCGAMTGDRRSSSRATWRSGRTSRYSCSTAWRTLWSG